MQNQPDKTLEEKRVEARRALEGEERRKQKEEMEKRKAEIEIEKIEAEREKVKKKEVEREEVKKKEVERLEKKKREEQEKEIVKRKKREAEERTKKATEEKKNIQEAERKAQKEALIKKILPKGKIRKPAPQKEDGAVKRVSLKSAKIYKVSPIRTYKTDLAETVLGRKESVVKIALAEKKKKEVVKKIEAKKTTKTKDGKKRTMIIAIIIIFFLALNGALMFYFDEKNTLKSISPKLSGIVKKFKFEAKEKPTPVTTPQELAFALVPSDNNRKIIIPKERVEILQIISKEMREASDKESIKNIYLEETVTITIEEKKGKKQRVSSISELLSVWPHNMPDRLSRSLGDKFMIGIYSLSLGENFPFLILTTNSYKQTFAGMFAWEKSILNDFYKLFSIEASQNPIQEFRDREIDGVDARVLTNTSGETILIYSFIDKDTLIITENEDVFSKILSKLLTRQ